MTDYTPTGKPDDLTRYDARALRREFELIAEGIGSKEDISSGGTVSTTSMTIGSPGTQTFEVELGKLFTIGQSVFIADVDDPAANNMTGVLVSYDSEVTGVMEVSVTSHNGSGTLSNWSIGVSNPAGVTLVNNTFSGYQNFARATVAADATSSQIWIAAGNQIDFTGVATVNSFPNAPQGGAERTLICAAACSFLAGANMEIDGVVSGGVLTVAANDIVTVRAITTTKFRLSLTRYEGLNGGADTTSSAVDITLNAGADKLQIITMTAAGKKVTLPAARTRGMGVPVFVFRNAGLYRFSVRSSGGAFLCNVDPGRTVTLTCSSNSTVAGVWQVFGDNLDTIYTGNTSDVVNAVDSRNIAVATLSSTKAICVYRNVSTTFLNAVIFNFGAASGTPIAVNAEISQGMSIAALTSTKAVVVYRTTGGATKGYVLDVSGDTITPGTVFSIDAATGSQDSGVTALSTTQLLCAYYTGTDSRERVLTVSGSTLSAGSEVIADATATPASLQTVHNISGTKALYALRRTTTGNEVQLRLQSIAGTVPTPTGTVVNVAAPGTDISGTSYTVTVLSTDRALVCQPISAVTGGSLLVSVIDISSTTPVVLRNKVVPAGVFDTAGSLTASKLSANQILLSWAGGASLGVDAILITLTSEDSVIVGNVSEGIELTVSATAGYLASTALDATHVLLTCRNSSTYLSGKVLELPA